MIKYETKVLQLGPLAQDFIDSGILVLFDADAPSELAEFAVLHHHNILHQDIVIGDDLLIDEKQFRIVAVGSVANKNLASLGHLVIKFNGNTQAEMPGDVSVENISLPPIKPGTIIKIVPGAKM
ncbi:MAG: PTS glucitol/sorbitol transporter subunit IIA [Anaerolineae bacterium]|nr:PTS glucitol/sorbitol transporter subunit IIA [Anaerolineae bacterium]